MGVFKEVDLYEYTQMKEAESENFLQMQVAYIAYMMIGSYFKSCRCSNPVRETNLFLHYSDMRQREQTSMESQMEREFIREFYDSLEIFASLQCEAIFYKSEENFLVYFHTGLEEIKVIIYPSADYDFERIGDY